MQVGLEVDFPVERLEVGESLATFWELRRTVWLQRNEQHAEWLKMRMDRGEQAESYGSS